MLFNVNNTVRDYKMDFERAVELRRQRKTYADIGKELGYSAPAVRRWFVKEYERGNLLELSGYRAAPRDEDLSEGSGHHRLRGGNELHVGRSISQRLTMKQKHAVLDLMIEGRYQTLNDMLLDMLLSHLDPSDTPE
jgi:hypothetical protein